MYDIPNGVVRYQLRSFWPYIDDAARLVPSVNPRTKDERSNDDYVAAGFELLLSVS